MNWLWLFPITYLLAIGFEWTFARVNDRRVFGLGDSFANLGSYAGYILINPFVGLLMYTCYTALHEYALFDLSFSRFDVSSWQLWGLALSLFFLDDLTFYCFHRASHRTRLFWASHVTHHSSEHYNLTVALRQTWTPFVALPFWLPLPFLGFDPLTVLYFQIGNLAYQFFLHTQLVDFPRPLAFILNTPAHHRVHHGANHEYVDKNYGGVLIVWDRLFGSFAALEAPVRFGIGRSLGSDNPIYVGLHGWIDLIKEQFGGRQAET